MRLTTSKFFNVDIAVGAAINLLFFFIVLDLPVDWIAVLLCFNSVWVIYTLDRILDARKVPEIQTIRHQLHKQNEKVLTILITLVVIVNLVLLVFVPIELIIAGCILGIVIMAYLIGLWMGLPIPKELFVASVYTGGIALAPVLMMSSIPPWLYFMLVQHFILAFNNLTLISRYEQSEDKASGQFNIVSALNGDLRWLFIAMGLLFLGSAVFYVIYGGIWGVQILFVSMLLLNAVILTNRYFFSTDERYRVLADFAFYLPLVALFW